jgi:hypothetical protein
LDIGLISTVETSIVVDRKLDDAAGDSPSEAALERIAKILISVAPPPWFKTAIVNDELNMAFVPEQDRNNSSWLGVFFEHMMVGLHSELDPGAEFRAWLGQAGESVVMANEINRGRNAKQVSKISDRFGYDVESTNGKSRYCIEVKTTTPNRSEIFHITKNETRKAATLRDEWKLVQIILRSEALLITKERLTSEDVEEARTLDAVTLLSLTPVDKNTGIWVDSAEITPPPSAWKSESLNLPKDWQFSGLQDATGLR